MSVICIASTKGGVGKSTLLVNLAVALTYHQQSLFVLDADRQGSSSKWGNVRDFLIEEGEAIPEISIANASGAALVELAQSQREKGKIVLVDTAGVDSKTTRQIILESDLVLTLSAPSPLDLWEIDNLLQVCRGAAKARKKELPVGLVFNRVSTHSKVTSLKDGKEFLIENLIFPDFIFENCLKDRIVYQHSMREGKGVSEYQPKDTQATQEILNVYTEIIQLLNNNYINIAKNE